MKNHGHRVWTRARRREKVQTRIEPLTTVIVKNTNCGQNRFQINGICKKKLLFSTVLMVVDQVMLYPTKCETRAALIGIDMPVKKMLKKADNISILVPQQMRESKREIRVRPLSWALTDPENLIRGHLAASRELESISQNDECDIT